MNKEFLKMNKTKCITFDKAAQDALPEHIKDKMKVDKAKAREQRTLIKLKDGCSFTGTHFGGLVKVVSIDEENNVLNVRCVYKGSEWCEKWDLQHTIWGFAMNEYRFLD